MIKVVRIGDGRDCRHEDNGVEKRMGKLNGTFEMSPQYIGDFQTPPITWNMCQAYPILNQPGIFPQSFNGYVSTPRGLAHVSWV
jgi:hypothetical protein